MPCEHCSRPTCAVEIICPACRFCVILGGHAEPNPACPLADMPASGDLVLCGGCGEGLMLLLVAIVPGPEQIEQMPPLAIQALRAMRDMRKGNGSGGLVS